MGRSEDVQKLCEKADELLSMSEEVVASFKTKNGWKNTLTPHSSETYPQPLQHPYTQTWQGQGWGGMAFGEGQSHTFRPGGRAFGGGQPHSFRPGGGVRRNFPGVELPHTFRPGGGNIRRMFAPKHGPNQSKKVEAQHPLN